MRMGLEPFSGGDFVVIQYAEGTEVDTVRIEVFVETKGGNYPAKYIGNVLCICFVLS